MLSTQLKPLPASTWGGAGEQARGKWLASAGRRRVSGQGANGWHGLAGAFSWHAWHGMGCHVDIQNGDALPGVLEPRTATPNIHSEHPCLLLARPEHEH